MQRANLFSDAKGQVTSGSNREGESTEAESKGGAARSGDEGSVELERGGCVVQPWPSANWRQEESVDEAKPFKISKWEAPVQSLICSGGLWRSMDGGIEETQMSQGFLGWLRIRAKPHWDETCADRRLPVEGLSLVGTDDPLGRVIAFVRRMSNDARADRDR